MHWKSIVYKSKVCPECHKRFVPRTYVQRCCSKICGTIWYDKEFRRKNGMCFQCYRKQKREYGGNEGLLKHLETKRKDLDKSIRFIKSGGKILKSDGNWNWHINNKKIKVCLRIT